MDTPLTLQYTSDTCSIRGLSHRGLSQRAHPMTDLYRLQRFLDAQERIYYTVLEELRAGRKSSHWIWFIFSKITRLGRSGIADKFAIASLSGARIGRSGRCESS